MELLRLQDVQLGYDDRVFKDPGMASLLFGCICLSITIIMFFAYRSDELPLFILILFGGLSALASRIGFSRFIKARSRNNWLAAVNPERMLIKFRSYLNPHLPADDPQVIKLYFSEIASAKIVKIKMRYKSINRKTKVEFRKYLDLETTFDNLHELKQRLKYERNCAFQSNNGGGKVRTVVEHWPVTVLEDNIIRIEWVSVRPGINKAIEILQRQKITIKEKERIVNDFTRIESLDKEQLESKILELAEREKTFAAIRLAERAFDCSTTEAKEFVESLMR